jgi:4-carboxymuconolactone decarboxylase
MPRIRPISDKSDVAPADQPLAEHVTKVFGGIRGPMSVMLHNPKLAAPVMDIGDYFRTTSLVPAKLRVLAILVAARERQGKYVWAAQVNAARRAGVSEEVIGLIRSKASLDQFAPEERAIIDYAEQLMRTNRIDQASFDVLKNRYGDAWLIELTTVMSYYGMLSNIVSAFDVEPPADGDRLPA